MIGELLFRTLASALAIAAVSLIARRDPVLGGLISVFPVTTSLVLIWLAVDNTSIERMADFTGGVVAGLVPTIAILVALAALLRHGVPLAFSGLAALAVWMILTVVIRQFGWFPR